VDRVGKNSISIFSSQHLYLVAFLICAGHRITNVVRNGRRVSFEFAQTPELLTDVAGFMSGASVPARQFSFELLKLKRMLMPRPKDRRYRAMGPDNHRQSQQLYGGEPERYRNSYPDEGHVASTWKKEGTNRDVLHRPIPHNDRRAS
jgi:hypothetical protein